MSDVAMHEYVGVILDAAKMERDKFIIPSTPYEGFAKTLRASYLEDTSLFVHLVVASARVKKSGLQALAAQLVELAKIGLDHQLKEKELSAANTRGRAATKSIAEASDLAAAQSKMAASLKKGSAKGIGVRTGTPSAPNLKRK